MKPHFEYCIEFSTTTKTKTTPNRLHIHHLRTHTRVQSKPTASETFLKDFFPLLLRFGEIHLINSLIGKELRGQNFFLTLEKSLLLVSSDDLQLANAIMIVASGGFVFHLPHNGYAKCQKHKPLDFHLFKYLFTVCRVYDIDLKL